MENSKENVTASELRRMLVGIEIDEQNDCA